MTDFLWKNFFKNKNNSVTHFLRRQSLFSSLTPREIKVVEKLVHRRSYFAGEIIFKPKANMGLYMIIKGQVNILYDNEEDEHSPIVNRLTDDDFFGELSLIQQGGYSKTIAKAVGSTELLGFFRPELLSLIEKSPKLGSKILMNLLDIVGLRLQKAGEKLAQLSTEGDS